MSANLLRNNTLRSILKSRWYPGILQAFAAGVFALIVFELVAGPALARSNFGTALTWIFWWPLIPILFVFLGRFGAPSARSAP